MLLSCASEVHYTFTDFRLPINQANNPAGLMSGLVFFFSEKLRGFMGVFLATFSLCEYLVSISLSGRQLKNITFLQTW